MDYLTDSVEKLYKQLVPSAIGSMLTATVASLIDTIVLSYYLGPVMLSSVSICMPIYMILNALALLIVSGGATLSATYIGKGDAQESNRYFTVSALSVVFVGLLLTIAGNLFPEEMITILGANETVWQSTLDYAKVLMKFMIPLMLYCLMLFFVRFDSDPGLALFATGVCVVTNLVLDVLFVGPLNMGASGAALATCLAYTIATAVGFTHFLKKKNTLRLQKGSFAFSRLKRILAAGLPLSFSQFGMAFTTSVFNGQIMRIAGELYVTVYAIITQLSMCALAFYEGIPQAAQPILAANFGAGKMDRVKKTMRIGVILELIVTGVCLVVYCLGAKIISGFFSITEGPLLTISMDGIRIFALSLPFTGLNMFGMYYLQSRERVIPSAVISLLNGTVLMILCLLGLTVCFGAGGIWWTWFCAQALTMIYTVWAITRENRKEKTNLF